MLHYTGINGIIFKNFNVFLKFYTLVVEKLYLLLKINGLHPLQYLIFNTPPIELLIICHA